MKMVFVGAGSMAEAMIQGIVQAPRLKHLDVWVTNHSDSQRLAYMKKNYNVETSYDRKNIFAHADIIVLAMKPKDAAEAMLQLREYLNKELLVISILAGLSLELINGMLGEKIAVARAMPNTSATIQESATGLSFNEYITEHQKETAISIFSSVGSVTIVRENQLDLVTGLAGSGPAYIYYVVEAMEQAAVELGLSAEEAKPFILQTLAGASKMLQNTPKPPSVLRKDITSPGGTTEAGIKKLEQYQVKEAIKACIKEATLHSGKLRAQFEQNNKIY
ncbi:pyrroline-5-carboxylate reductase [Jeotgalibacillus soli]|uniref:Pyrroline-5-carboxylate reductase n=1 Tax=Jeotgalibacillus soli TaxID=889306 RepID=A0A0C2VJV8_9BACL|nr:pyrroline-5-carboxylate reductase [Jeotgalibacillus soli]KIL44283.1 pyrroline-5-carboxylate reductase [Jeotgalibacillus soli]